MKEKEVAVVEREALSVLVVVCFLDLVPKLVVTHQANFAAAVLGEAAVGVSER